MISCCKKVWFALWLAFIGQFAFCLQASAATVLVNVDGPNFVPSAVSILVGDSVRFKMKSQWHVLVYNGTILSGDALAEGQEYTLTINTDGTHVVEDYRQTYLGSKCTITVTQPVNAAPTVNITNLALRVAIKAGSNVVLRASADDEDGSIRRVVFQYGVGTNVTTFTNIGTSSVSPYSITWTNPAAGRYQVRAQAYDNLEVFANSPRINLSLYTPFTNTLPAVTNVSGVSNLVFQFNTDTGLVYAVEVSTNLTNWSAITTNTASNSAIQVLDPNLGALTNRLYRIRLIP